MNLRLQKIPRTVYNALKQGRVGEVESVIRDCNKMLERYQKTGKIEKPPPPVGDQVISLSKAVAKSVENLILRKKVLADKKTKEARTGICDKCEHRVGLRCHECGCRLPAKIALEVSSCVKWTK